MKVITTEIDKKTKKCYEDTPENRAAGLVKETEVVVKEAKIVTKDGVRIRVTK